MTAVAAYAVVAGPWGPVHLAATDRAVVALELLTPTDRFVMSLEGRLRGAVEPARLSPPGSARRRLVERVQTQLEAYFAADLRAFDLPIDVVDRAPWDRAVLGGVRDIGWGEVTSYGRLARRIGRPGAARAVGGAVGRNPIGLLIPCHRIIAGDGSLGGYGGDWWGTREQMLEIKRTLLALEGIELPARRLLDGPA